VADGCFGACIEKGLGVLVYQVCLHFFLGRVYECDDYDTLSIVVFLALAFCWIRLFAYKGILRLRIVRYHSGNTIALTQITFLTCTDKLFRT